MRGRPLKHDRSAGVKVESLGQLDKSVCGRKRELGVRAWDHRVRNTITNTKVGDARANRRHGTRPFRANGVWELRDLVLSDPLLDIDEVDAGGRNFHHSLTRRGLGHLRFLVFQNFRSTVRVDSDGFQESSRIERECRGDRYVGRTFQVRLTPRGDRSVLLFVKEREEQCVEFLRLFDHQEVTGSRNLHVFHRRKTRLHDVAVPES